MSTNKTFKPQLAPNDSIEIKDLPLPLLGSYKIDGIRCVFKDGGMYSRSLKPIVNDKLHGKFDYLKKYSKENKVIIDGELYCKSLTFPELSGVCRRLSHELPEDLTFYAFDCISQTEENSWNIPFCIRLNALSEIVETLNKPDLKLIDQIMLENEKDVENYFQEALNWGSDGLILRSKNGKYKYGRGTLKEGLIFKLKPFLTFDAQIIGVLEGTIVDPNAEKKINELGYSETSRKKGDRIPSGKACDFEVLYEGKTLKVSIAMTDEEKREVWQNRCSYIGRWIEYKGMLVGAKDLPRHPVLVRMRSDRD
jgi:DNA ligase-1